MPLNYFKFKGENFKDDIEEYQNISFEDNKESAISTWTEGISAILSALEQINSSSLRETRSKFIKLYCLEESNLNGNCDLVPVSRIKRQRSDGEKDFEYNRKSQGNEIVTSPNLAVIERNSLSKTKYTKQDGIKKLDQTNKTNDRKELIKITTISQHYLTFMNRFEELSIDYIFIQWTQFKAEELNLDAQELFDLIKQNLGAIYLFLDRIEVQYCSNSSMSAYFNVRSAVEGVYKEYLWIINNFSNSDLNHLAPTWKFACSQITLVRSYVLLVEDMLQILEIPYQQLDSSDILSLVKSKTSYYGNINEKDGYWSALGLPQLTELLTKVQLWFETLSIHVIQNTYDMTNCRKNNLTTISPKEKVFANCFENFKIVLNCFEITGKVKLPLLKGLYFILARTSNYVTGHLSSKLDNLKNNLHISRDWDLWLISRLDSIISLFQEIYKLPKACNLSKSSDDHDEFLSCFDYEGLDNSETQLCYSLVDMLIVICSFLTPRSFSSQLSLSPQRATYRSFNPYPSKVDLKPSSHLILIQAVKLTHELIKFSQLPEFLPRLKAFSEHVNIALD